MAFYPIPAPLRSRAPLFAVLVLAAGAVGIRGENPGKPDRASYLRADGTVQIVCLDDFKGMIGTLGEGYRKANPGPAFDVRPANSLAALQALAFDTTGFAAVGTESLGGAAVAYGAIVKAEPFIVRIAHASLNPRARFSPLAVIVNRSNPLDGVSMDRLSRIFTSPLRKPMLVTWSQLGVAVTAGDQRIHPVGLPWSDHYDSEDPGYADYLFTRKFAGAPPARSYRMEETYDAVVRDVAEDPDAIGITALNRVDERVKVVAVSEGSWGPVSRGSEADIRDGRYALDRYVVVFVRRMPGRPIEPWVKAYLDYALSEEGQKAIAAEAKGYMPLDPRELSEERAKLAE